MNQAGRLARLNRRTIEHDLLEQDLAATRQLLFDALALHGHYGRQYVRMPAEEVLQQLRLCRRTVRQLARDYAAGLARYRSTVTASRRSRVRR